MTAKSLQKCHQLTTSSMEKSKTLNCFIEQAISTFLLQSFIINVITFPTPWLWCKTSTAKYGEGILLWFGTLQRKTGVQTNSWRHSSFQSNRNRNSNWTCRNLRLRTTHKEDQFLVVVTCSFQTTPISKSQGASSR